MRAAIITNGVVTNIIEVHALYDWPGCISATGADIGSHYTNGVFTAPAAAAPSVPASVTRYQLRTVLRRMPATSGTGTLFTQIDSTLTAQGGDALAAWQEATEITRSGTLVNQTGAAFGFTSSQLDDLFIASAGISA